MPKEQFGICASQRGATSEPMYLRYAQEFQVSKELERDNEKLDRINLFIVYYFGAYLCSLDLRANFQEQEEEDGDDERASHRGLAARTKPRPNKLLDQTNGKPAQDLEMMKHFLGIKRSRWKRELRFGWFPQVALACYLASIVYLLIAAYYQYVYDFDLLRLLKLRRQCLRLSEATLVGEVLAHELAPEAAMKPQERTIMRRMNETQAMLDRIGPNRSLLAECLYLVVIAITLAINLAFYLYHRFWQPYDHHMVRDLLDREQEDASIRRMLLRQVQMFVNSARVYHEKIVNSEVRQAARHPLMSQRAKFLFVPIFSNNSLSDTSLSITSSQRREQAINRMVREMLSSGSLTPLYKSRSWTKRRARLQFQYHLLFTVYAGAFCSLLVYAFFFLVGQEEQSAGGKPSSWCLKVSFVTSLFTTLPSMVLHGTIFIMVILEQVSYNNQLCIMIKQCIVANTSEFLRREILQEARQQRKSPVLPIMRSCPEYLIQVSNLNNDQKCPRINSQNNVPYERIERREDELEDEHALVMNINLIFSLLHYKIFVAQLMPLRHSLGIVNLVGYYLLFAIPIITFIHEPYLGTLNDGRSLSAAELKLFTLAMSTTLLASTNLALVPICYMFARCKHLYTHLASLMAHINQVRAHPRGVNLYDLHAASYLLKELADSRLFLERMTVRAGGLSGTYTLLLRAHFWYGLLAILILAGHKRSTGTADSPQKELLSEVLSDPLGVYSQLKLAI